ncbi:MAG: tyrosine-protein phosphatase [Treponema sp.]|jgi:protein-tyrosine phosphatase|nr:tyrosine-protein phosphatase [Treponema sp.]
MKKDNTEAGKLIPLEKVYNMRDLGGYATEDGRRVCFGKLYRSGELHKAGPSDKAALEERRARTIVDFRGEAEITAHPDLTLSQAKNVALSISPGSMFDLERIGKDISGEAFMTELYGVIVDAARAQYRAFFRLLADAVNTPLLFHCSAGKDRTGIGAALIYAALGVERETIYADYLLSATYLAERIKVLIKDEPYLEAVMSIRREYLETAFRAIDERFGGMDRYLREELGADTARLRELYLEPPR